VGRPWDKVYAEISERLRPTNAVQQHVRDHLQDYVVTETWIVDAQLMGRSGCEKPIALKAPQPRARFYVDPRCGLLRECTQKRPRRRPAPLPDVHWDGPCRQLRCIGSVWYALRLEPIPHDPGVHASLRDRLLRRSLQELLATPRGRERLCSAYGRMDVFAAEKHQLGKRELRRIDHAT
jgi:hypothetical protein